jgi:hypothetical protein
LKRLSAASRPGDVHLTGQAVHESVTGKPLWWLRLDGLTLFGAALALLPPRTSRGGWSRP